VTLAADRRAGAAHEEIEVDALVGLLRDLGTTVNGIAEAESVYRAALDALR
jgi:hypothetical protein